MNEVSWKALIDNEAKEAALKYEQKLTANNDRIMKQYPNATNLDEIARNCTPPWKPKPKYAA